MDEVLQWIQKLITEYGAINVIIMALTIILTNIIKKPIVNRAESFAESAKKLTGVEVDKSVITRFIFIIPIVLCFIFYFLYGLIEIDWKIAELDWGQVFSNAVVYGMLSISIFETVKGFIKAYISKKNYNEAKKQLESENSKTSDNTEGGNTGSEENTEIIDNPDKPQIDETEENDEDSLNG